MYFARRCGLLLSIVICSRNNKCWWSICNPEYFLFDTRDTCKKSCISWKKVLWVS